MCPDPQLLSIYLDGELPSPWKEKMQEHFAQCPRCREKYENLKRLHELLKKETHIKRIYVERIIDEPKQERTYTTEELQTTEKNQAVKEIQSIEEMQESAKKRIWYNIKARRRFCTRSGLLHRRLSIPLPAAAAAVVILMLTTFWFSGIGQETDNNSILASEREPAIFTLATEMERIEEIPGIIPTTDISGVLQYLTPTANIIILQLPESANFFRSGEPAIIRAADYQRNFVPGRSR
jgi:thioredoxin-related protein